MRFLKVQDIVVYISFILFGLYPLIPNRNESLVPIIFILSSFVLFIINPKKHLILKPFIIMGMVYIVFFISAIFSENTARSINKLETMASLIAIPIACFCFFGCIKLDFKKVEFIFIRFFFLSNITFSLIALFMIRFYRNPKFSSTDADFFRNAISDIPYIGDHSIYLSLFFALAIIFGFDIYKNVRSNIFFKSFVITGILILSLMMLLLMSKGVIIALLISIGFVFIYKNKSWKKILLGGVLILVFAIILLPKGNNRFIELVTLRSFEKVDMDNSTSVRFHIMKSSFSLAFQNPFFGVGIGDVQNELDREYNANGMMLEKGMYNSHNQYLFVWLSCGIFGIFIFLIFLFYIFKVAIMNNDSLLLYIIILYSISFLFENILSRQSGVILFAFLVNFLVLKNVSAKDLDIKNE